MSSQPDQTKLTQKIHEIIEKIYAEADPLSLKSYWNLIKRNVSFFRRANFTAYLLMELDRRNWEGQGGERGNFRKSGKPGFTAQKRNADNSRFPLPEEESRRLFISVGRSRRVFPREILELLTSKTAAVKEDIGDIRILDNYSFVQVKTDKAEEIIAALNGKPFRGKPLSVNYAKSKRDAAEESEPLLQEANPGNNDPTGEVLREDAFLRDEDAGQELPEENPRDNQDDLDQVEQDKPEEKDI